MENEAHKMIEHAQIYLESAHSNKATGPRQYPVAYDEARHALELAGKTLLLHKTGKYPTRGKSAHRIGNLLARKGLIPQAASLHDLNRVLDHHTRGSYGFYEEFTTEEVQSAISLARILIEAATRWPDVQFHPPIGDDDVDSRF